jgi:Cys-rich repeat protein
MTPTQRRLLFGCVFLSAFAMACGSRNNAAGSGAARRGTAAVECLDNSDCGGGGTCLADHTCN